MTTQTSAPSDADRLLKFLNAEKPSKVDLNTKFDQFSDAVKLEVAKRLAETFEPPPSGPVLSRLTFIKTVENTPFLRLTYLGNLRSPDASARAACLYGLKDIGYERLSDLALLSLRDDADEVCAAAVDLMLPDAKKNPSLSKLLGGLHAARKGNARFHMTVSLLEAHQLTEAQPRP